MLTENHEFNEIYKRYKNLVLKAAYIYTKDFDAAEDIMQEAFLKLYKEMEKNKPENIKAWLCATAKYSALNYKKRADKEIPEQEIEALAENHEKILTRESTEAEYFEKISERERFRLHERIFTRLLQKNPRWYEAIMLVCVLEYPQAEAAEKAGMSANAFYVMLHRARNWIKKNYGAEYEELSRF